AGTGTCPYEHFQGSHERSEAAVSIFSRGYGQRAAAEQVYLKRGHVVVDCAACDRLPVEAGLEELVERCKVGFGGCNEYVRIDPVAAEHHRVRVAPISASTGSAAVGSPLRAGTGTRPYSSILLHVNGHLAHSIYPLRDG